MAQPSDGARQEAEAGQLDEMIRRFLVTDDEVVAGELASMIQSRADGDVALAWASLQRVRPWAERKPGRHRFPLKNGALHAQLPVDYAAERPSPVCVCFGAATDPDRVLDECANLLGDVGATWVLVTPAGPVCDQWHTCPDDTATPEDILLAIRRNFHVDGARVYSFGWDKGGAAAWVAGLRVAREWAGVILLNANIHADFPSIAFPLVAANLRPTRLLVMWDAEPGAEDSGVVAMNRALARSAIGASVETEFEELPATRAGRSEVIQDRIHAFTAKGPSDSAPSFEFWIPAGSSARFGWVTAHSSLPGEPRGLQVAAKTMPTEKGRAWLTDRIAERMSHVSVRQEGPRLVVEAQRCSRIDVHWPPDIVATGAKRTVVCNGVTRFDDVPKPSIRAMLEHARRTWDFGDAPGEVTSFTLRPEAP